MKIDVFPIRSGYLIYKDGARYRTVLTRKMKAFYRLLPDDADIVMHPKGHPYAEYGTSDGDVFPPNMGEMSIALHSEGLARPVSDEELLR